MEHRRVHKRTRSGRRCVQMRRKTMLEWLRGNGGTAAQGEVGHELAAWRSTKESSAAVGKEVLGVIESRVRQGVDNAELAAHAVPNAASNSAPASSGTGSGTAAKGGGMSRLGRDGRTVDFRLPPRTSAFASDAEGTDQAPCAKPRPRAVDNAE